MSLNAVLMNVAPACSRRVAIVVQVDAFKAVGRWLGWNVQRTVAWHPQIGEPNFAELRPVARD